MTPLRRALVRWVPESAALGISALVAAAYLRRIRRRRAQARAARGDDEAVATPDPAAVRLEARLAPFADAPVLEWLELANRHLTAALRAEAGQIRRRGSGSSGSARTGSSCAWTRLSTGLRDPSRWPTTERAGGCPPTSIERCSGPSHARSWLGCPCCCPSATTPAGRISLHLEPGDVVSLEGPDAPSMLAAWVETAKSWPWAEQVGVARDTETAEALAPLFVGQNTLDERATVLFTGDPGVLSEAASTIVASVTSSPSRATTRVTVTAEGALIEPFGITVRPCRLDPASEGVLAAIDHPGSRSERRERGN